MADQNAYDYEARIAELEAELAAAESRAEAAEATIKSVRRALSSAGYCGDGNLEQMVTRALKEAEGKGTVPLTAELQAASSQFPVGYEGTVSEMVRRVLVEKEAAEANACRALLLELDGRADELMKTTSFSKAWQQAVQEKLAELEPA